MSTRRSTLSCERSVSDPEPRDATPCPEAMLSHWGELVGGAVSPLGGGLINHTYRVDKGASSAVLQRLHPIFEMGVNDDLDTVGGRLAAAGLVTPRLIRTSTGEAGVLAPDGIWRAITFVEGQAFDRVESREMARAAGALTARFHGALWKEEISYQKKRRAVHDTKAHLEHLERALETHSEHALYPDVAPLAAEVIRGARSLPSLEHLPARNAHGDLKISNLLFDEEGEGLCLIDLDTLNQMIWPFEMGDALRSWCNPAGEDDSQVHFDLALFEAALEGYASQGAELPTKEEREALVDGVKTICAELSARFLADALEESYFGWDSTRFPSRAAHNLLRGRGQWSLFESVRQQEHRAQEMMGTAFRVRGVG